MRYPATNVNDFKQCVSRWHSSTNMHYILWMMKKLCGNAQGESGSRTKVVALCSKMMGENFSNNQKLSCVVAALWISSSKRCVTWRRTNGWTYLHFSILWTLLCLSLRHSFIKVLMSCRHSWGKTSVMCHEMCKPGWSEAVCSAPPPPSLSWTEEEGDRRFLPPD